MTAVDIYYLYDLNPTTPRSANIYYFFGLPDYDNAIPYYVPCEINSSTPDPDNFVFANKADAVAGVNAASGDLLIGILNSEVGSGSDFTLGTFYPIYDHWFLRPDFIQIRDAALDALSGISVTTYGKGLIGLAGASNIRTYAGLTTPDNQITGSVNAVIPVADAAKLAALTSNISQFTNDTGYLTSAPVTTVAGRTGTVILSTSDISGYVAPVNADWNASTGLAKINNKPTIPTNTNQLTNGSSFITLSNISVTGNGSYNSSTGAITINSPASLSFNNPTRTLNSSFQISSTRNTMVSYTVDVSAALSISGGQTGTVTLKYADDSGFTTNVVTVQSAVNGNTGTLTIGLGLTQTGTASVTGIIPAGKYVQIQTANTSGTPSFTFRAAQEVLL